MTSALYTMKKRVKLVDLLGVVHRLQSTEGTTGGRPRPSLHGCYRCYRNPGIFSCELSAVVSDDRVRDPETENDVLDEIHGFLEANFGQGLHLDPLSEFVNRDKQVSQVPSCLLEGS
jgi:hypothetical protein